MPYELGDHWALTGAENLGDPEQNEARTRLSKEHHQYVRGCIVVGRAPGDNAYIAVIEHSFSMAFSKDRANLWLHRQKGDFGGTAKKSTEHYAELFTDRAKSGSLKMGSGVDAEQIINPATVFHAFDIDDPFCPVGLDWKDHTARTEQAGERGISKYDSRNRVFYMRDADALILADANGWYSGPQIEAIAGQ